MQIKKKEGHKGVATSPERTGIGMGMGWAKGMKSLPPSLKQIKKKKGQAGVTTNPGCAGSGKGVGVGVGKPAPLFKRKKKD